MSNPIYDAMNNVTANRQNGNLMQKFNEFRRTFQGNPREQVEQLLRSGKMSQAQFNQLAQMANQFQRMMK